MALDTFTGQNVAIKKQSKVRKGKQIKKRGIEDIHQEFKYMK